MSCNRNDCAFKGTNTDTCDYILVTGKRRGCPAGPLCLRYKPVTSKERKVPQLPSTFKKERSGLYTAFETMYEEGFSDVQIAEALGVSRDTVSNWRRKERLPSQATRKKIMQAHAQLAASLKGVER